MSKLFGLLIISFVILIGCTKNADEEKPVAQPSVGEKPANDDGDNPSSGEKPSQDQDDGEETDDNPGTTDQGSTGVTKVKIFLIGIDDNGASGKKIGANDSAIPVLVDIEPTKAPLKAALTKLLSLNEQIYGQSGFYHSLYQSNLEVKSAIIDDGEAVIELTGNLKLGGALDNPRVKAQIEETALQFDSVNKVSVFIDGKKLDEVLSLK
ncbi:GerMN domain-containing protein [Robertmurraya korlensis]|uniref:GerMN domain-containing protein n=1 Tax=Robertmurraya korlensis TaxID=519977 RepID=UPI00203E6F69|nr:GerMN domain-containing protein [Robertmurraya korlensis]MCM3601956.1 GerMN domain-containing protein [Robertmurraya korlensis]